MPRKISARSCSRSNLLHSLAVAIRGCRKLRLGCHCLSLEIVANIQESVLDKEPGLHSAFRMYGVSGATLTPRRFQVIYRPCVSMASVHSKKDSGSWLADAVDDPRAHVPLLPPLGPWECGGFLRGMKCLTCRP